MLQPRPSGDGEPQREPEKKEAAKKVSPSRTPEARKAWRDKRTPEKVAADLLRNRKYMQAWHEARKANPEFKEKRLQYGRKSDRKSYGIANPTGEQKHGACKICNTESKLYFDHDHATGQFRGWICRKCNMGLGLLGDTAASIERALEYLKNSECAQNQ